MAISARQTRKKHKWKKNTCIYCGCYRIKYTKEVVIRGVVYFWDAYHLYDPETGEEKQSALCKTKQYILKL
jgi:hypothetical protein